MLWGFEIPKHSSPVPLSVQDRGSIFEILRKQGFALWSEKPGSYFWGVLSPGCSASMVGWVMTRQSVCVTALRLLRRSLPAPASLITLCLPQTKECLPKPMPWKTAGGFFRPSAALRIALFQFLLGFASLRFRLISSHRCHCQRSCVIPVGKLPKFLQALGSCYYGSKSKLCLG